MTQRTLAAFRQHAEMMAWVLDRLLAAKTFDQETELVRKDARAALDAYYADGRIARFRKIKRESMPSVGGA